MNGSPLARIGITLGDPRGIGPEVTVAALRDPRVSAAAEYVLIGPSGTLADDAGYAYGGSSRGASDVVAAPVLEHVGRWTSASSASDAGRLAGVAIARATERALAGDLDALVTAPIDKLALNEAGWHFPGHTEMLQELTEAPHVAMMMCAERTRLESPLRVVLATTHLPLRSVSEVLTAELLVEQSKLTSKALRDWWGIPDPRLALCAFNPHASDGGLFGDEEERIYAPAIAALREAGIDVTGPIPADTVFGRALRGEFQAVIAPYHDVGMAPLKTISFGGGVNVTVGLPFPRTSPDHGTALDIAGTGRADPSSMIEAILLAARLASRF